MFKGHRGVCKKDRSVLFCDVQKTHPLDALLPLGGLDLRVQSPMCNKSGARRRVRHDVAHGAQQEEQQQQQGCFVNGLLVTPSSSVRIRPDVNFKRLHMTLNLLCLFAHEAQPNTKN